MIASLCTAVLGLAVLVSAQVPIPRREVGFVYKSGQPSAPVHLDFYIDQICPDSKYALPTILQVADHYGASKLQLTSHLFPLPYHRNSFYASKGSHIVDKMTKGNLTYDWIKTVYDNIESLSNKATMTLSDEQIIELYAVLAKKLGLTYDEFIVQLMDPTIEEDTRVAWKYCCTRGVAATPTFMVNDVFVSATPSWTLDDWKKLIDPLLTKKTSHKLTPLKESYF